MNLQTNYTFVNINKGFVVFCYYFTIRWYSFHPHILNRAKPLLRRKKNLRRSSKWWGKTEYDNLFFVHEISKWLIEFWGWGKRCWVSFNSGRFLVQMKNCVSYTSWTLTKNCRYVQLIIMIWFEIHLSGFAILF